MSGKSQADNFSLRSQDEDIRDYAEHEGLPFDTMFTDVGSGLSTKQRPKFLNMGEHALDRKNSIIDVMFHDLDRFTRNIAEFFIYTKDLIKAGITLHLAMDGEKYDYHSEEKWHQRLIAAQAESKRISRRTKRGQRTATRMGLHIGKPPWGYMLVHDSDVNEGIRSRHRDQGPTRCHSSPSPASGLLKCGPCWSRGIDSNLEINRQKGTVRLRCSKKKRMGREFCTFTGARLDEVLAALQDRLNNNFLTEDTLDRVIGRVADASRECLEEQETNRAGIRARKGGVRDKIASLKVTLDDTELGPRSRRSLTDDLKLLEEQEELDQEDKRISEATEDARIFVNNRAGIIETAMNLKTYTDPKDLEAQRELMHLFIERVEVFHDGHGVIEYDLPVHCEGSADGQTREAIYFKRTKDPVASQSCGIDGSMGVGHGGGPWGWVMGAGVGLGADPWSQRRRL